LVGDSAQTQHQPTSISRSVAVNFYGVDARRNKKASPKRRSYAYARDNRAGSGRIVVAIAAIQPPS
jgi:hypothetical protein